ncbi:hypothetical protein [Photobacterium kagoshimensis]|uniref:hypothetical protein n=1 Tax=Photobacterium kagoshimensis TaxID=2910242 RepID=UPI003D0B5992
MKRLMASIEKLDRWSTDNNIDISNELASIEAKIKRLYIKNTPKKKPLKSSIVKPKKNNKESSNNHRNKKQNAQVLTTTINFDITSKLIKGVSHCHFCKVKRLECREHTLLSGNKVLVCKDCRRKRHIPYKFIKKKYYEDEDALSHLVSGSYGSGKASR